MFEFCKIKYNGNLVEFWHELWDPLYNTQSQIYDCQIGEDFCMETSFATYFK